MCAHHPKASRIIAFAHTHTHIYTQAFHKYWLSLANLTVTQSLSNEQSHLVFASISRPEHYESFPLLIYADVCTPLTIRLNMTKFQQLPNDAPIPIVLLCSAVSLHLKGWDSKWV